MNEPELFRDSKATKNERNRRYRRKVKLDCLMHYGGLVCFVEGCTEHDIDNLELHHPNGDGNKDRAEKIGRGLRSPGGWNFYVKLRVLGWPEGYVVICIRHHDELHGRVKPGMREKSSPGEDTTRYDDIVPF